jgi:hypothetical protein
MSTNEKKLKNHKKNNDLYSFKGKLSEDVINETTPTAIKIA